MSDQRHDPSAEIGVLAACLESSTARQEARRHLTAADFYDPRHEAIWEAMSHLDRTGASVDPLTVNSALAGHAALALMPDIVTTLALPDNVGLYAETVRGWATKRRVEQAAMQMLQKVRSTDYDGNGLAAEAASMFAALRDGSIEDDVTALTVRELLADPDDEPDWVIPGLLERQDRLMLTGEEGLGKSHMLRQFAISVSAGLHPFNLSRVAPMKTLIIDCENSWRQVRRKMRPAVEWAAKQGQDPSDRMMVDCHGRMDITRDKDLARIHGLVDAMQPDIVIIGPLYRLVPRALQTDDDTAPVLAALDTVRDKGPCLLMEAHAGHAMKGNGRDLRPRGSSSLLGWPEFGYGMRNIGTEGYCDLVPWRGDREERQWPQRLRKSEGFRWVPHENTYGYGQDIPA